jgi:hypothetical protein
VVFSLNLRRHSASVALRLSTSMSMRQDYAKDRQRGNRDVSSVPRESA